MVNSPGIVFSTFAQPLNERKPHLFHKAFPTVPAFMHLPPVRISAALITRAT